ncbi:unnamed protein product [Rotaria sordida]|uniref:Methyltransferase type 11 domain-containing protein n=1 Tax=Rotaria sordida TaxID=392033 RepID=A0A819NSH4_9BILA|nr:unnamed protein product [Rotaria sordida]
MENPVVNHRLTILEELINNQINKENVQIKQLQDKIEILEEELKQHKIQIKHLEDQVMNLQHRNSKESTMESIITTNIKGNMENQSQNVIANIKSGDKITYKTGTNFEKEETNKIVQLSNYLFRLSQVKKSIRFSDSKEIHQEKRQLLDLNNNDEINKTQTTPNFNIVHEESIHENKNKSKIIINDASTTSKSVTSKSSETNSQYSNFYHSISAKDSLQEWQFQTRSDHRLAEIKSMFELDRTCPSSFGSLKISSSSDLKEIISRASINAYFDMICRDDSTTVEIGEYLNLSKENIFGGTDYDSHNDKVTFVNVNLNQSTIDLADNRVDLITCFVTLHHVSQLKLILSEFVRILRPSGYLIIREHNCENKRSLTAKYLNFVHAFMMIAHVGEFADVQRNHLNQNEVQSDDDSVSHTIDWKQKKLNIIKYTKSIQYRTRTEWQQEIENVGFHLKATLEYDQSTLKNPQELFYAVFQLNVK